MARKQILAVATVAVFTLAACASSGPSGTDGDGGGSTVVYLSEPDFLDPALSGTVLGAEVLQRVFDPLVHYNPETAEIELTGAAESYDVAEDGQSITFQLREATFHNGEPVNAESFVRALTRAAAKDTASTVSYHLDGLKGFAALNEGKAEDFPGVRQGENEQELVLEFDTPNPEFVIRTGHLIFSPIPEAALDDTAAFNEHPIGNGPYMMDGDWEHNTSIKVTQFEDYSGPEPGSLDSIEWKLFTEIQSAYLEFESGAIDASSVPPESYEAAASTYEDAFLDFQLTSMDFLSFHGIEDVNLRRAVSMAMNREKINDAVFAGQRVPAMSYVPPGNTGHRPDTCTYCEFNVERAKEELEQADVPNGFVLELTFNSGAGHDDWVQAAATQIQENLGIKTKVVPGSENFGDYLKSIKGITGVYRYGWGQDYPTPDNWLSPFYQTGAGDNYSEYSNPEFDDLIDEARSTLDEDERLDLYAQAEDIIIDQVPGMPMFYKKGAYVYSTDKFATFPFDLQLGIPHWEGVTVSA